MSRTSQRVPKFESDSTEWTKEGPLEIDDNVWIKIALKILAYSLAEKIFFDSKKGYFSLPNQYLPMIGGLILLTFGEDF